MNFPEYTNVTPSHPTGSPKVFSRQIKNAKGFGIKVPRSPSDVTDRFLKRQLKQTSPLRKSLKPLSPMGL